MSGSWDDYADAWDANMDVIDYADKAFNTLIKIENCKDKRVLDFGCGTGLLTQKISVNAGSVVALDPSEKMVDVLDAKKLTNVRSIRSELTFELIHEQALLSDPFDVIVASSSLAFVPDYLQALTCIKSVLKRGGLLIQWDWLKEENEAGSGFSRNAILHAYEQVGLTHCDVTEGFMIGDAPVLMAVGRY